MATTTGRILWAGAVVLLVALAAGFRLPQLAARPLHADEATRAWILDGTLGPRGYRFDPRHFHGPTLTFFTAPVVRAVGQTSLPAFEKGALRLAPALAGVLTVWVIVGFRRQLGAAGAMAAALLAAVSPLLAYYSRMGIHETLLGLFAVSALAVLGRMMPGRGEPPARPPTPTADAPAGRPYLMVVAGILLGLMLASKATAVISFVAWAGAAWLTWGWPKNDTLQRLLVAAVIAIAVAAWLYTDGGRYPGALVDVVRTFGVYQNDPGHDKPATYYLELLLWPKYRGGFWWGETAVGLLAVVGAVRAWATGPAGRWSRFLAWATLAHWAAYALIAYKTPWLMVGPWLHTILLAGYGAMWRWRVGVPVVVVVAGHLAVQTCRACFPYASDDRNPYTYSPTSPDVEELSALLGKIAEAAPTVRAAPVAVVGRGFWPLPWYLRQFPRVGYWPKMADAVAGLPVVLAMPAEADAVAAGLHGEYFQFWRGLRHETPVAVFVRQDCWQQYLARPSP